MRFTGAIFDMGDILYDASIWRRAMSARLAEIGVAIDFVQFVQRWEEKLVDVYQGRAEYWARLADLFSDLGLSGERHADMIQFAREKAAEVESRVVFDGVPETLDALKQAGIKLAVLSDTESGEAKIRGILTTLGIEPFFDAVVTSRDIGFVKPLPEAFAAAVAALGLPIDRCCFVGHDLDELEGARAAGLFTIAYNYAPGMPADAYADHFSRIAQILLVRDNDDARDR